jgi:hypothetical protein
MNEGMFQNIELLTGLQCERKDGYESRGPVQRRLGKLCARPASWHTHWGYQAPSY